MPVKKEVSCAGAQMPGVGCDPFTSKNGWQVHSGLLADHSNLCLSKVSNYRDISDHSIETIFIHEHSVCKGQWAATCSSNKSPQKCNNASVLLL